MRPQLLAPQDGDNFNFNPRTPCGVRPSWRSPSSSSRRISIHAPLAGCDINLTRIQKAEAISIHAPLAGCDEENRIHRHHRRNFNPRTPCGVRHEYVPLNGRYLNFNPRTPCGVRPLRQIAAVVYNDISIHAPLAGCDPLYCNIRAGGCHFNPRTPCGVRPVCVVLNPPKWIFQSTHPLRGATY